MLQNVNSNVLNLGGDTWQLVIPLSGASFTFSDPREALERQRSGDGIRAVRVRAGGRSGQLGEWLALMEMKIADAEPAG